MLLSKVITMISNLILCCCEDIHDDAISKHHLYKCMYTYHFLGIVLYFSIIKELAEVSLSTEKEDL